MLDQVARDVAAMALSEIKAHQSVCAERQRHIDVMLAMASEQRQASQRTMEVMRVETSESLRLLYRHQWVAIGTMVLVLSSAVGALLMQIWAVR